MIFRPFGGTVRLRDAQLLKMKITVGRKGLKLRPRSFQENLVMLSEKGKFLFCNE